MTMATDPREESRIPLESFTDFATASVALDIGTTSLRYSAAMEAIEAARKEAARTGTCAHEATPQCALRGREPQGDSTDDPMDSTIILPVEAVPVPGGDFTLDNTWGYAHQPTVDWAGISGGRLA